MARKKKKPYPFIALGTLMIIAGSIAMLACTMGGRLNSEQSLLLPFGFITVATGSMLLTRSTISVFFLALYALTLLILGIIHNGWLHPLNLLWIVLLILCLPLSKNTRALATR